MTTTPTIFKGLLPRGEPGVAPLKVPGVLVGLTNGLYFCPTEPVTLRPGDWFDIAGEDLQLAEYGYPKDLEEKVGIQLEPIESVWAREDLEVDHGFFLGWWPDQKNQAVLREREAKAIAKSDLLREARRRLLRSVLEGLELTPSGQP